MTNPTSPDAVDGLLAELNGPASSFEKLEAILTCPTTYLLADVLPDKPHVGRPRDYPKYMWIVYLALVNYVWETARRVETELGHDVVWSFVRRTVKRQFPDNPEMWLPKQPMRRWHYAHAVRNYLRKPAIIEELKAVSREQAAKLAKELGLFGENEATSWTHPSRDRFLQTDGKVVAPLYKAASGEVQDEETGEIKKVRFDPDAKLHTVGGGDHRFGTKFAIVSARTDQLRVFLDHEYVPQKGEGGEAGAALRCFERVAPLLPGAQGVNYDMAMRGTHIDRLMRELGWLIVTGVPEDRGGGYKEWHIEDVEVEDLDGRLRTVHVYARRGAAGIRVLTDTGEDLFLPLERIKTARGGNPGRYRFYNEYELPPEYRAIKPLRIRLHGNEEDAGRGFNRAEHLRAIPPTDPDYHTHSARRVDAESVNRKLSDTLYWRRAHSVGHVAQDADLLGFGLGMNALTWHRHRKRDGLPAAA